MDTRPLNRVERAMASGLHRALTKMDIGPNDRVIVRFHFRDGGRTLHHIAVTVEFLTPEGWSGQAQREHGSTGARR